MNLQEFQRLRGYMIASRNAPRAIYKGKRAVKSKAKHCGIVLKNSRVMSMNVETQHFQRRVY